jgi:lysosomal Pro-X carboxypeptidase
VTLCFSGESLPYGVNSFTPQNLALCTVEQALADYAVLLTDVKKKNSLLSNSPVITVGGSYGGMLSAWFRIKYPHIVEGALAASAPILQFHGVRSDYIFYQIVTQDYAAYASEI